MGEEFDNFILNFEFYGILFSSEKYTPVTTRGLHATFFSVFTFCETGRWPDVGGRKNIDADVRVLALLFANYVTRVSSEPLCV